MRNAWLLVGILGCASAPAHPIHPTQAARPAYPVAKRGDTVDQHGTVAVADPYRWLEAMDSPETRAWVSAENRLTDSITNPLATRDTFRTRITELVRQERTGSPVHRGSHYFWLFRDGQHDSPFIMSATSLDEPGTVVLDANTLADGGKISFAGVTYDRAGTVMAYGTAEGGGDWQVWRLRDLASGKDLPEQLTGIKYYPPVLVPGGVYYSRFPTPAKGTELTAPDRDCKVYLHRLGTPVAEDRVVYERPDRPSWQFELAPTTDDRHLVISIGDGEVGDSGQYQLAVLDVATNHVEMLHDHFDAEYVYLGDRNGKLYFMTNEGAPNKRIVALELAQPGAWQPIVAEGANAIEGAALAGDSLLVTELHDAHSAIVQYDLRGAKQRELALPGLGSAFASGADPGARESFGYFTSFTYPGEPLRIDLTTGAMTPWHAPKPGFDPAAFETRQVFVTSSGGARVPMFITMKRGAALDGTHSTLLTGYGFGGVSLTPYFDPAMIAWLEYGGAYALVNVRGGGEYGEAWHDAGKLGNEQHKLDDFNAAAAWLADHHVATASRIGAIGTSGGGLLVAAAVVQHPERYGAMFPIAGVLDLLRFQLFGEGAGWQADLGHPDVPAEFAWLYKISPLHNLVPGAHYPATLVITSDHDVRVAPLHSYKFAAALQAAQGGPAPIVLRVAVNSGHGGSHDLGKQIEQDAEILAFAAKYLELPGTRER